MQKFRICFMRTGMPKSVQREIYLSIFSTLQTLTTPNGLAATRRWQKRGNRGCLTRSERVQNALAGTWGVELASEGSAIGTYCPDNDRGIVCQGGPR